jgi:hypothetical protein
MAHSFPGPSVQTRPGFRNSPISRLRALIVLSLVRGRLSWGNPLPSRFQQPSAEAAPLYDAYLAPERMRLGDRQSGGAKIWDYSPSANARGRDEPSLPDRDAPADQAITFLRSPGLHGGPGGDLTRRLTLAV